MGPLVPNPERPEDRPEKEGFLYDTSGDIVKKTLIVLWILSLFHRFPVLSFLRVPGPDIVDWFLFGKTSSDTSTSNYRGQPESLLLESPSYTPVSDLTPRLY